ncbi:outer membrane beta-barrel protein [Aliivibrio fischeri]|uniref:outer membrane beta-barrel protein n=1 Tax=Aliivibrio fischeri TaxID=668 RepID=UPI00080DC229|nr:outer membrane beta-barrel protein [Aliivibrio fischeri]OCH37009.1 TetR family transcriptional regulator [Aliivibrio fischeri]
MIRPTKTPISFNKLILLTTSLVSSSCYAYLTPKPHIGPAGVEYQSNVAVDYGYDDNVNYQSDHTPHVQSDFFNVKPFVQLKGVHNADVYTLQYTGDYRQYQENNTSDDYYDHHIAFIGSWKKGLNNDLLFTIENTIGHENRGEGLIDGLSAEQFQKYGITDVLETNMFHTELRYSIDKQDSIGKLSFAVQYKDFTYDDRTSNFTSGSIYNFNQYIEDQEWDQTTFTIELFDQASSRTRFRYSIVSNLRHYKINNLKDTNETFFIAGIKTIRTGKTTIDANIAWLYKDFPNNPDSENFGGLNWDIDIKWSPVRHSSFHFYTDQSVEDPTEVGGYVLNTEYGTNWEHFWWSSRLSTTLGYRYKTSADKEKSSDKVETKTEALAKITYKFRPSIQFELSYQQLVNESNKEFDDFTINSVETVTQTLGYDKSLIMFTTKVQI